MIMSQKPLEVSALIVWAAQNPGQNLARQCAHMARPENLKHVQPAHVAGRRLLRDISQQRCRSYTPLVTLMLQELCNHLGRIISRPGPESNGQLHTLFIFTKVAEGIPTHSGD